MSAYDTVTIGTQNYNVYCNVADADIYINASMSSAADTWRDTTLTTADMKSRSLVSATRWLDSVQWLGTKADDDQALLWPRTGIDDVEDDSLPDALVAACAELAMALADNPDARADLSEFTAKGLRAGSVHIDYFRPEGDTQVQTPFPATVMALISQWLAGSSSSLVSLGVTSYGTDCKSDLLDTGFGIDTV